MPPEGMGHVRRVLAVRLDNIGDVIMLGPALRTIRHNLPAARISLLASPAGSQVAPLLPWVDEVLPVRSLWQDVSGALSFDPGREQALIARLSRGGYEAAFIFTSFSQSPYPPAYACYLAGIPIRAGQSREFGGQVLSHCYRPEGDDQHQVDRNLSLLNKAGFELSGTRLELAVPERARRSAREKLRAAGVDPYAGFIALAPGASAAARRYAPQRFAVAAAALAEESRLPVVIIGSAREAGHISPALAAARGVVSLVGQTDVLEFAAVIERARLLLANNSAALHIADAFAVPMVILYSGTEYESQWRPRHSQAQLLRVPTTCSPCYRFECPYNQECLDIPPQTVLRAALAALEARAGPLPARVGVH